MGVIILFFMIAVPIAEIALFIEVGGVPADQVGRIRVRDRHSFVFLPVELADAAIAKLNGTTQGERELTVEFARK